MPATRPIWQAIGSPPQSQGASPLRPLRIAARCGAAPRPRQVAIAVAVIGGTAAAAVSGEGVMAPVSRLGMAELLHA
ncbi:hypothetical protein LNKW23_42170 [Paralimibaculum aggregatum]|uniref:Uncharacterized protein n=1 Tax=Paralimibaculum aggregatum TaxID=3036245 RepID=A0ABQ6LSF2_9RHOB|nr:hypothetical protein LNKW23_42170 [Limibaculum sp. NKW23]